MFRTELNEHFQKGLDSLTKEIEMYANDADYWLLSEGISNSAGNLCLHLCGNLRHFIGAVLGKSGYVRQRDIEFSTKDLSKSELLKLISETKHEVQTALQSISNESLDAIYPIQVFGKEMSSRFFLLHLHGHLQYHLGQINYHRRLLSKN